MVLQLTHEELARAGLAASEDGEVVRIDPDDNPNASWSEAELGAYAVGKFDLYSALVKKPTRVYFWAGCALWFLRERLKPKELFLARLAELKIAKTTAYEALALYEGAGVETNVIDMPITKALAKWAPPKDRKPITKGKRKYDPVEEDGASEVAGASGRPPVRVSLPVVPDGQIVVPGDIVPPSAACNLLVSASPTPPRPSTVLFLPDGSTLDVKPRGDSPPASGVPPLAEEGTADPPPPIHDPARVLTSVHHMLSALLDAGLPLDAGLRRQIDEIEQVISDIKGLLSV